MRESRKSGAPSGRDQHAGGRGPLARQLALAATLLGFYALSLSAFWTDPSAYNWMHLVAGPALLALTALLFFETRGVFAESNHLSPAPAISLLVLVLSGVAATGGMEASPLAPVVFLLLALLASVQRIPHAALSALVCTGWSVAAFVRAGAPEDGLTQLLSLAVFYCFFSVGLGALIGFERARRRKLENVVRNLRSDRAELRAESVLGGGDEGEEPQKLASAIEGDLDDLARHIERSLYALVERLGKIVSARSCALYLLDSNGQLRLREAASSLELDARPRLAPGEGLIGWVLENGAPVVMNEFDGVRYRLPYYEERCDVGSFLAVPVPAPGSEEAVGGRVEHASGVLCADLPVEGAISPEHQQAFFMAATQVSEILANARTLLCVLMVKRQLGSLYVSSTTLSGSLRAEEIAGALLDSARRIADFDLGAVVTVPAGPTGAPTIRAAVGQGADKLMGAAVDLNGSRTGWVLETGQALPLSQNSGGSRALFHAKEKLPRFEWVLLLPFASESAEGVLGCLVLASRKRSRQGSFVLRLLELLSRQATAALLNARLFERMESLATTDGLTGLCNHRTFQERLDEELRRAQRTERPLSVVLTDIDHFKKFNDTYGHPVGDAVLRHLSRIYRQSIRDMDLVARYGGEEFVFVFPETRLARVKDVCERIRKNVARTKLREGELELSITISLGIACFPDHAATKSDLIECADKALYRAKETGRNRVCVWSPREHGEESAA
ncbi:MAG: diguanylate cyclase [Chrysiogenetes bacterium]|nr:diguanylate cyclase [Chrysiogenetes bacterium]